LIDKRSGEAMPGKHNKFIGGFTIAELLIALAITSVLLAAVAVAFKASTINYQENEDIFKTINNARQALLRMTRQIRTGDNFNPAAPNNRCSFFTANNEDITYEYRSADNKLYLITNSNSNEYVLCNNVTSMSFIKNPTADGLDVKSIQISMTVASGDIQRTISAATVVRKNPN
jgi:prepilin-type N-terminal cleavage/methylation domain-containing protein